MYLDDIINAPFQNQDSTIRERQRDRQRSKVYAAEMATHSWPKKEERMSLEECEQFVLEVWSHPLVSTGLAKRRTSRPPCLTDGRSRRRAASFGGRVALPRLHRCKWVILHELAHELSVFPESHGPEFCGIYLRLVLRHLGFDVYVALSKQMIARNVRVCRY